MFMTYCPFGDLNKYFKTRDVQFIDQLSIMQQIAKGMEYLHTNKITHRDLKPDNILIVSFSAIVAQLTDFDVSKVLDPAAETSAMSSNVGTMAYKTPGFFQRTKSRKIKYHRNVDIFAAGLTFLAMVQYEKGSMLVPHIETPRDESELHAPIGSLIAERIKYDIQDIRIVTMDSRPQSETDSESARQRMQVKELIQKMTCHIP